MNVAYLPANQAWAIVFGDALIAIDGQRLWTDHDALLWALAVKGLGVRADGEIY
jgi:hypothetical protein